MRARSGLLVIVSAVGWFGCGDPGGEDEPEALCGWSAPHRLFAAAAVPGHVSSYGRADELPFLPDGAPDALYFSVGDAVYLSGPCGEDLRDLADELPDDGLRHVHTELALDCEQSTVHRRDGDGALAAVYEGVSCDDYFVTSEGFFAAVPAAGDGVRLVRLLDFGAPELPVAALHDVPLRRELGPFVGPRDLVTVEKTRERHRTGHWGSPFVALTTDHRVLRLDPRGGAPTEFFNNVAALWPSPDGEAFAFQLRLPDGTGGDVYVYAGGEHHLFAADPELPPFPRPWWSADGAWFAMSIGASGDARDRVMALPSGQVWWTAPDSFVQRELPDGALWLSTVGGDAVREIHWDPESGLERELWAHPMLPWGSVRAADDGLELLIPEDGRSGAWWWGEGQLLVAPYDESPPLRLSKRVSPGYTRLPDGRIVTPRATPPDREWPTSADLILIDPADDSEQLIDSGAANGRWSPWQLEATTGFHRVLGDLLTYVVVDESGARSGVWAVSLSHL
jgi:hypothetical protein